MAPEYPEVRKAAKPAPSHVASPHLYHLSGAQQKQLASHPAMTLLAMNDSRHSTPCSGKLFQGALQAFLPYGATLTPLGSVARQ